MPLISSPIDGSPMREVERFGVKIDICESSGGIWLDKGELEKIITAIRNEALEEARMTPPPPPQAAPQQTAYYDDEDDYYDDRPQRQSRPKHKKRDSMFENIMDIFDM